MKTTFLVSSLLLLSLALNAQDIQSASLKWSVSQLNDLSTGSSKGYTCDFKTSSAQEIIWVQKTYTSTFNVQQINGTWNDVQVPGQITYSISFEGETGTLTFKRAADGVFVTLDLSQSGQQRLQRLYTVSSITPMN